jgi:hypothetical protein
VGNVQDRFSTKKISEGDLLNNLDLKYFDVERTLLKDFKIFISTDRNVNNEFIRGYRYIW